MADLSRGEVEAFYRGDGPARPLCTLDEHEHTSRQAHAAWTHRRLLVDPRHVAVGAGFALTPRAPLGLDAAAHVDQIAYRWHHDEHVLGLRVALALARGLLLRGGALYTLADVWLLAGALLLPRHVAGLFVDRGVPLASIPDQHPHCEPWAMRLRCALLARQGASGGMTQVRRFSCQ